MKSSTAVGDGNFFGSLALFGFFTVGAFIVYSNILNSFFVADDFELIHGAKNYGPFAPWTPGAAQHFFRPLVTLSVFLDYRLWGLNPIGYHAANLIFHAFNSCQVFFISQALGSRIQLSSINPRSLAWLSGITFLLLPCHTEAVTWISGRTDLLATLFCLSSFRIYMLYCQRGRGSFLIISLCLFLLALLSKESAIIYPLLILCYEIYRDYSEVMTTRSIRRSLRTVIPFVLGLGFYLIIKYSVTGSLTIGYGMKDHLNIHFFRVFKDYLLFLTRPFIPPVPIDFETFFNLKSMIMSKTWRLIDLVLGALLLTGSLFLVPRFSEWIGKIIPRRDLKGLLLFLFCASVILFIPGLKFGLSIRDTYNERFIYLATTFYSICLMVAFAEVLTKKACRVCIFLGLMLFFTFSLYRLNGNWQTAGQVSRNSLQEAMKLTDQSGKLYLISLPGEMKGAHIHVNFQEAMELFSQGNPIKTVIISYLYMVSPKDGINVFRNSDRYRVTATNPEGYFFSYSYTFTRDPVDNRFFTLVPYGPNRYDLRLKEVQKGDCLVTLSRGKLICLERL